jgi:hypothetical protein
VRDGKRFHSEVEHRDRDEGAGEERRFLISTLFD